MTVCAVLGLVAGCHDETYNMHCELLRESDWSALCKRFQSALILSPGHGQVFGNRSWLCSGKKLDALYCQEPRVPERLVDEILSADTRHRQREWYRDKNRREPTDQEIPPGVEMDPIFATCTGQLKLVFERAAAIPSWANETCAKLKQ